MASLRAQVNVHTRPAAYGRDSDPQEIGALNALAALAQRTRLAVFRLLLEREPQGMPAGAIADTVHAPQNTVSAHLAVLARADLILSARRGRNVIYRANVPCLEELVNYLLAHCCRGNSGLGIPLCADAPDYPSNTEDGLKTI